MSEVEAPVPKVSFPEFRRKGDWQNFYLEALDRDVKKHQENPSIGLLPCRDKDDEEVEYVLSRNLSPALVAQYQFQLPDKKLIAARMHELLAGHEGLGDE